jgi:hypothetical protein
VVTVPLTHLRDGSWGRSQLRATVSVASQGHESALDTFPRLTDGCRAWKSIEFLEDLQSHSRIRSRSWCAKLPVDTAQQLVQQEETFQSQLAARKAVEKQLLQNHFALYLAPPCLALCEQIQRELPRELRDNIYEYLLDTKVHYINLHHTYYMFNDKGEPTREYYEDKNGIIPGPRITSVGHLADINYVGEAMRNELAETYYRTKVFSFEGDVPQVGHCLEKTLFRTMDPWYIGAKLCGLVKNLELTTNAGSLLFFYQAMDELPELLRLEAGIRINIKVEASTYWVSVDNETLAIATSKLFPLLNKLQAKGHTVTIEIVKDCGTWPKHEERLQHKLAGGNVTANNLELALRNVGV